MKSVIPITTLLILLALGYWWLSARKKRPTAGLLIILALDLIIIFVILISRPFVFDGKDANNLIIYVIYLATAGALFSAPVADFKDEILKESRMPKQLKQILISYIVYSVLILVLIILEAFSLRGLF